MTNGDHFLIETEGQTASGEDYRGLEADERPGCDPSMTFEGVEVDCIELDKWLKCDFI